MVARLYVVVDATLPPAQIAVQAVHAAIEFAIRHPACTVAWNQATNTVALLVANGDVLHELVERATWERIRIAGFHEPDLGDRLTAIAIEPTEAGAHLCRNLQPALSP